jgi:hypothetical protein
MHSLQYTPLLRLPPLRLLGTLLRVLLRALLSRLLPWLNELMLPKLGRRRCTGTIGGRAHRDSDVGDDPALPAAPSIVIRWSRRRDTHSSIVVLDRPALGAVVMDVE